MSVLMQRFPVPALRRLVVWGLPPLLCVLAGAAVRPSVSAAPPAPPATPEQAEFDKTTRPFLTKYCAECHNDKQAFGGVNLGRYTTPLSIQQDASTWRKVMTQVSERVMPPQGSPHPSQDERDRVTAWVHDTLIRTDEKAIPVSPGRVLIHRLSRSEYNNSVRDLFGVTSKPADSFPADGGGGGGFDNNADTLFVPPILMERYLIAAGQVVNEAPDSRVFVVQPGKGVTARAAAKEIIAYHAPRVFRRPLEAGEAERYLTLYDRATREGLPHANAVRFTLKALLVSPSFLFRVEARRSGAALLNDYELASRLSYFLWSSTPDDTLLALAREKRLHNPATLQKQVRRMLADEKARAFADNFVGQWLRVRDLYTTALPDPNRFKEWTPALRDGLYREPVEFFGGLLREDASLLNLLDSNYTYANAETARYYGLPPVEGNGMRRVLLPDNRRGGVLTMGAVLTLTAYPQRTSPVLRGKWVLEEILGTPSPPPPPNAGGLSAEDAPQNGLTFRQRLEKHRSKPECASCHARMDPIGFGLENFDAIGRWRTAIGDTPVDATGTLASGETFTGPAALKKHLLTRRDDFARNLTEKMLAYALGRGLESYDLPAVRKITTTLARNHYRADTLVEEIVKSYPFQYRSDQ